MSRQIALIVEDDLDAATIYATALRAAGFETEVIPDGDAALERLPGAKPAVVILDLHLPFVAGEEILARIRDDADLAETRVIVVTGDPLAVPDVHDEADLVLIKPVGFHQLRDLAERLKSGKPPGQ